MNLKPIILAMAITALMIGSVCAAGVGDFKTDKSYENVFKNDYCSVNLDDKLESGIIIFQNEDDDAYNDTDIDEAYDELVHDDASEYLEADDDFKIEQNSDNTTEFNDTENAQHGLVEIVNKSGDEYVIVFWADDSSDITNSDLSEVLADFNKENEVEAIAY